MAAKSLDIEAVKAANPIEKVVAETEPLTGRGRYWHGEKHDSLVVDTHGQAYFWNSKGLDDSGDVIEWCMKHRGCADFKEAVEWLCRRAGLAAPEWSAEDAQTRIAARAREDALTGGARWFVRQLRKSEQATAYARGRGWTDETIRAAGLGYSGDPGDRRDLVGELAMHQIDVNTLGARAVLSIPPGMLVYAHVRGGRVRYLSARGIAEKRHYNVPVELAGERQPYFNHVFAPGAGDVVVVEGQADAVTLAQWDVAAVALAGTALQGALVDALRGCQRRYMATDADEAGVRAAMEGANTLGPLTRILTWPVKDANEWLQAGATAEECRALMEDAAPYVVRVCVDAGRASTSRRDEALLNAFRVIARLETFDEARLRKELSRLLDLDQRQFSTILRTVREGEEAEEEPEPKTQVQIWGGYYDEHLFESLYDPETKRMKFAVRYPDGRIEEASYVEVGRLMYVPEPADEMLLKGAALLPSALGEELPIRTILERIHAFINRYLEIPVNYRKIAAWYVLLTWVYDSFSTVPYLRALGDYGTGKSRFVNTIGYICFRPIVATGATTVSPLFRELDARQGTLVIDEIDLPKSDAAMELIKIFNVGNSRLGGIVWRSGDEDTNYRARVYNVYGPKIFGMRKAFQDKATESRCITHRTGSPTERKDIPLNLQREFLEEALRMRNILLRYRMQHWKPEVQVDDQSLSDLAVEPRLKQVMLPLLTLIDDEQVRSDIRAIMDEYNRQAIAERQMTIAAKLVEALLEIKAGPHEGIDAEAKPYWDLSLKRIAVIVNAKIAEENDDQADDKAETKRVKNRRIASIARDELQLRVERMTTGSRAMGILWDEERIEALKRRYGLMDTPKPGSNGHGHPNPEPPPPPEPIPEQMEMDERYGDMADDEEPL